MALQMIYEKLLHPQEKIFHENTEYYHHLEERHLQAIWYEQKYLHPLKTIDGKNIEVISPGLWNSGKGADFCKAHLKIDGEEIFGDIEIHLHEEGWKQHRHHEDPYYNGVVLHLAYWEGKEIKMIKQNGTPLERVILEKQITLSPQRLIEKLDLDHYPYKEFLGSGRCAEALFRQMKSDDIQSFFASAAKWRLKKKFETLTNHKIHTSYLFAAGMAAVLGYRHNSQNFLELFAYLLPHRNLPEDELLSLTLGITGFFEPTHAKRWHKSPYYTDLNSLWGGFISKALHQANLRLDAIRPHNHPVRRLALLVKILHHSKIENMELPLLNLWEMRWKDLVKTKDKKQLFRDMLQALPAYEDSYWNSHFTFEVESQEKYLSLIGDETRLQIITNVFFPILFEKISERKDIKEMEAFSDFYGELPEVLTGKRKYLSHRFFGENAPQKISWGTAVEQGAYQLHSDFCTRYESSCVGCPFVERMINLLDNKCPL